MGFGVLIGCIAILVGYSDIEDVTGWDRGPLNAFILKK